MRKNRSHLTISLIIVFIITCLQYNSYAQNDIQGTWSGTVRMKQVYAGEFGSSTLEITTNFNENRGSGVMKFEGEVKIGNTTHKTTCNGAGTAELYHLNISKDDDSVDIYSYYIHVIGPEFTCSPAEDGPGGDGRDITIGDKVTGNNKNILNGIQTNTVDNGAGKVTTTLSWDLRRAVDVELIVTPLNYDTWLPEPGKDELTTGSVMTVSLKLQGKNGKPLNVKANKFQLRLSNTSQEKGIALNAPKIPMPNQRPDLRFLMLNNASFEDDFQFIQIPAGNNGTSGQVKIGSYDGGGWTTLTAFAILEGGDRIQGTLLVPGGKLEIPIPKRDPGSNIAKAWADANGNPGDFDDKEEKDPHASVGDGFTAYEEYRGFMSKGQFVRFDPKKKELAVRINKNELSLFDEGLGWFEQGTQLKVVRVYINEVANDRVVNFNSSYAHDIDQYALKLDKGSLPDGKAGKAFTTNDKPEIPKNTTQVVIATASIHQNYLDWVNWARSNNLQLPWTEKEYVAQTVAHELGHGVKVSHHGDGPYLKNDTVGANSRPIFHIFNRGATEITSRPFQMDGSDRVCSPNTQASGDLSCVMAYIDVCDWARIVYADGSVGLFQSPLLPIGKNFCTKKDGTSINAGTHNVGGGAYKNYFGDAANGKCLNQITLR